MPLDLFHNAALRVRGGFISGPKVARDRLSLVEDLMDILKALKGEESKLLKKAQAIRAAIDILDGNNSDNRTGHHKRSVSKAARAKMAKSQRARWAKIKAAKKG